MVGPRSWPPSCSCYPDVISPWGLAHLGRETCNHLWKLSLGSCSPFVTLNHCLSLFDTSVEYLIPPWNISYLRGIFKHLRGIFDTSVEYLTPSVEDLIPPLNISYLRGIFNPLRGIFDTSVVYLAPSVEYFIPPWNI